MASNLGSLILQLSANTAQLQSDLGKAYKLAEDTADRMKRAFAGIAGAVGVGLSADAFKDFIASSIDAQDAAVKFSQKVGVATDSIAGLQSAAAKAGVDSGAFATAMGKLAQSSAAAANGAKQQAAEYAAMGISVKDASGQLKSSDVLLGEIANKFTGYKDGVAKTTLAIALFGKAGADMIPLLNGGNAAIKEQIDLTKQLGAAYNSEAAKAAEAFNDKLSDIKVAVSGVGNQIASALLPALNDAADAINNLFKSDTWKSWLAGISAGFASAANAIEKAAGIIAQNWSAVTTAVKALVEVKILTWAISGVAAFVDFAKVGGVLAAVFTEIKIGAATGTLAVRAFAASAALADVAIAGLATAGEALLGMIGGIPGLIAIAATGIYFLATRQDIAEQATDALRDSLDRLKRATGDQVQPAAEAAQAAINLAASQLKAADAALANYEAQQKLLDQQRQHVQGALTADITTANAAANSQAISDLRAHIADLQKTMADGNVTIADAREKLYALKGMTDSYSASLDAIVKANSKAKQGSAEYAAAVEQIKAVEANAQASGVGFASAHALAAQALDKLSNNAKGAAPNVANLGSASDISGQAALRLADALNKDGQVLASLRGQIDPVAKAYQAYVQAVIAAQGAYDKEIDLAKKANATNETYAQIKQNMADKTDAARVALDRQLESLAREKDVVTLVAQTEAEQLRTIGLTGQALEEETALRQAATIAQQNYNKGLRDSPALTAAETAAIKANADAFYAQKTAAENSMAAAKEWAGIWTNGANSVADAIAKFATGGIKKFSDFGKALRDIALQTVEQIIAYFLKLQVINPILNGLFGGAMGMLPTAANAMGASGMGGGFGMLGSLFGGGASASGGGSGFSLFSPTSWISAGKNLWSGFTSGNAAAGSSFLGSWSGNGSLSYMGGNGFTSGYGVNLPGATGGVYTPGAMGYGLGIAGGLYAGYNRFQSAGGGVAGLAGGLTYGIGTAGLIGGIGSIMAGGTFGAGLAGGLGAGAAAGAGMTGLAAAIPVVGWIALAAMIVDKISGGKLFGTSYQTKSSDLSLAIGPEGGTATASLYQEGQKALFGGIKRRTQSIAAPDDAVKAAQDLFDAIQQTMESAAKATETAVVPVIQASIDTITEYDKKGHATSTKYLVKAFGQQWEEATQELAQKRIVADAILQQVAASKAGADAIKIAQQWQSSADLLADGTQMLLGAAADMAHGIGLLGNDGSLADIAALTQKLAQSGETLTDAYARLETETQTVTKFLEAMHVGLGKTGADLVTFIDDMTSAAGGLQNLQALWSNYYSEFYSSAEQAANNLDTLQNAANTALGAIGEDAGVSMAQFRADFEKALPTLSAEDVISWLQAGDALAKYTAAINQNAAAANQAAAAYVQNFQQLVQTTQGMVDQLFGTGIDQLKAKLAALKAYGDQTGIYDLAQMTAIQKQINDTQATQDAAAKLAQATQLIGNLGQVGALTGNDLATLAGKFNIPLDKLAQFLGTDAAGTQAQYKAAVDAATAALQTAANTDYTNKLLADILAQMAGKPLPFSDADLNAARGAGNPQPLAPSTKPVPRGASGGPVAGDTASAVEDGTKPIVDATKSQTKDVVSVMKEVLTELRAMRNERSFVGGPRNTRPMTPYAVMTP